MTGVTGCAPTTRVALFQPVLAHYRVPLFNAFDEALGGGLTVLTVPAVASSRLAGAEDELTARLLRSRTWHVGPLWLVPRALREVAVGRWDVVVLSWNARQVELLPSLVIARIRGLPVVLWGHGTGSAGGRVARSLRRLQARLADVVMTYGEQGRREVLELVPGQRVEVLLNTSGRPAPSTDHLLLDPRRRIGYIGRLDRRKHLDRLVGALAGLDGVSLDVVGDGPEAEALRSLASRLGVEGRVRWHGTITEWPRAAEILSGCDLVVVPSAAGLTVVDAFAAARGAVVVDSAAANGPEAELVVDGVTGFRYAPPTADGLRDCLRSALGDVQALRRLSAGAAARYRADLTADAAAATFAGVVTGLAGSDRARTAPGRQRR